MRATDQTLRDMAAMASLHGIHRGEQFGQRGLLNRLDISAIAYVCAEQILPTDVPDVFFTDECASMDLIESSEPTMAALKAISDALDSDVCETNGRPDYIEHVSTWAMTPPIGCTAPPCTYEVIGRILRAADRARHHAA